MGSTDPGSGQGLELLECDKRRKNPRHHTAHIWPTHKTSARHSPWTNLRCGTVCQVTLWMEQDELDGHGPYPGKVEPSAVAQLCWCQRCCNVLDPSGDEIRKSRRSQHLPPICRNDQTDIHQLCGPSVPNTEVPRKLSMCAFQWSL